MHKKSIEAQEKLQADPDTNPDRDDMRTESIAALRAKAHAHNAKIMEVVGGQAHNEADDIRRLDTGDIHKGEDKLTKS